MKILIVEDEPRAAGRLSDMLQKLILDCKITAIIPSVSETVKWLKTNKMPDLILMDISLSDGQCFSIFEIVKVTSPIIFCTAHDEFALQAFQTNGIAYLLKPVTEHDLKTALEKLDQIMNKNYRAINDVPYKTRFLIEAGDKIFPVTINQIICFNVEQNGLKLYMVGGKNYFIDYTASELETLLSPADFFRISRQTIIAKNAIREATTSARNARVTLSEINLELRISRERTKSFRQWFQA